MIINTNRDDYLIGINMESIVNGEHLSGYVLIPVDIYKSNKEGIDSLSVRIDRTRPEDDVYTKITISRDKLKSLFIHGDFLNDNNGQFNTITLKENLTIDSITEIPVGTKMTYSIPIPEMLIFEM